MAKPLVSDELWEIVQPLLPAAKPRRFRNPGRKPLDDRKALTGILFVLKSGIPREMLPQEMGLWFRDDPVSSTGQALLAPAAGLAASRSVAEAPRNAVAQIARGGGSGLVPGVCGQRVSAGRGRRGKRPAPIPRTGANPGASITCSLRPTAHLCRPS